MNIKEYKYKIEVHSHTSPMSTCADFTPYEVIEKYSKIGIDAIVITNHFSQYLFGDDTKETVVKRFLDDFFAAQKAAEKYNINVILGMEIRFPENCNDYLVYGIDENDIPTLYDLVFTDYETFYKTFKNEHNVIIQAHPFRQNMILQDPKILDGIEVFNMHPGHNSKIALAAKFINQNPHLISTCGTDFHHKGHEGLGFILSKKIPCNSFELAELLKSGDYLFDISGNIVIPHARS